MASVGRGEVAAAIGRASATLEAAANESHPRVSLGPASIYRVIRLGARDADEAVAMLRHYYALLPEGDTVRMILALIDEMVGAGPGKDPERLLEIADRVFLDDAAPTPPADRKRRRRRPE
jgi:hypothetical protein